jgi:hypothetical protein
MDARTEGSVSRRHTCGSYTTAVAPENRDLPLRTPGARLAAGRPVAELRVREFRVRNIRATWPRDRQAQIARMVLRAFVIASLLAGCGYQAGSYAFGGKPFLGDRTQVGCLDLAIARRPDLGNQAVVEYGFGNRCDKPQVIDLAYVHVVGRFEDGSERRLWPYDPRGELMALDLDGHYGGSEAIAYTAEQTIVQVCVDIASLVHQAPARWMCFGRIDASGEPYGTELAMDEGGGS